MCPIVVVYVTVSVSVTNVQTQLVRVHDCNLRPHAKTRITMLTALHSGQLPVTAYLRANSVSMLSITLLLQVPQTIPARYVFGFMREIITCRTHQFAFTSSCAVCTSPLVLLRHFPVLQIPVLQIQLSLSDLCRWSPLGTPVPRLPLWRSVIDFLKTALYESPNLTCLQIGSPSKLKKTCL